jgi:hypothetical protein
MARCREITTSIVRSSIPRSSAVPACLTAISFGNRGDCVQQAGVVNRAMVAVVTKGTMADAEMVAGHQEACFFLALCEASAPLPPPLPSPSRQAGSGRAASSKYSGDEHTRVAACAVDVSSGHVLLGEWYVPLSSKATFPGSRLERHSRRYR